MGSVKNSHRLKAMSICFLIAVLIGIIYFNSLENQFTNWDDGMIYQNASIRNLDWKGIANIFTLRQGNTYQPVRMLSYAVDYRLWKLNPIGYRVTNIILYMLTSIMVFFSFRLLSNRLRKEASPDSHDRVALIGSLLFAAHPVHVEAVTWLAARKEVLQGFFFFSAFYVYLKWRGEGNFRRVTYPAMVLLFFLLAVLSKPSAIVFPGMILLYEITSPPKEGLQFVKKYWLFVSIALVISAVFASILMRVMFEAGGIKHYHGFGFFSNSLVTIYAFLRNIKLLTWTVNYSPSYSFFMSLPLLSIKNIAALLLTVFLFIFSLISLRWTKVIFFSFFFFVISLLPYLNIVPISTLLADRYVFIASFSYFFLLGIAFDRLYRYRPKGFSEGFTKMLAISLSLFLVLGYSFMTFQQNRVWRNSYTLWSHAVENYPQSNTANAMMGVVYMDLGMDEKAIKHLEKAVQLLSYDYLSRNNLGIVYGRVGEHEKALEELMTAMRLRPEDDSIKINLSVQYQRQKEYEKAEEILNYLLSKNPRDASLYYRLGLLYREMKMYDDAISAFIRSMELAPHIINPYEELGSIYASRLENKEKAKFYYSKGIEKVSKAKSRIEELRWMIQDLER